MKMLIDGEFIDKNEHYDVINPYDGELIDTIPIADKGDVNNAIDSARKAQKSLNSLSSKQVSENLFSACEELSSCADEIARLIVLEAGKPYKAAVAEVNRSIETLRFTSEEAKRIYGESIPLDATGSADERFMAFTQKIPLGVVAAITPFNFPVNLALHKVAPAIAAKNAVVMKPSKEAPLAALRLAEIINNHFDDGVINAVTGYGSEIGDALIYSPDIAKISFTGSVATGLYIASHAASKKLTLELGGNDPLIVLEDANIEKAVDEAVTGAFTFSGQICCGVKRIILDNKVADEFIDVFIEKTRRLKIGNPMDESTDIGPVINKEAALNIEEVINNSIKDGAELLLGGGRTDCIIEPTILDNVDMSMEVVAYETFGPVAPILRVDGLDEAIEVANNTQYGLQAGVFTENVHSALRCANEIEAGTVYVNKAPNYRVDSMPFGGFKSSGVGKEGIKYAIEDMCRTKLIAFNRN
jgi:lactaldehyde dehydrogenase